MELRKWMSLTAAERLAEKGSEPPCPRCGTARVARSDYTRCNPCGLNWLDGEDLSSDPRIARFNVLVAQLTASSRTGKNGGAWTANDMSEAGR